MGIHFRQLHTFGHIPHGVGAEILLRPFQQKTVRHWPPGRIPGRWLDKALAAFSVSSPHKLSVSGKANTSCALTRPSFGILSLVFAYLGAGLQAQASMPEPEAISSIQPSRPQTQGMPRVSPEEECPTSPAANQMSHRHDACPDAGAHVDIRKIVSFFSNAEQPFSCSGAFTSLSMKQGREKRSAILPARGTVFPSRLSTFSQMPFSHPHALSGRCQWRKANNREWAEKGRMIKFVPGKHRRIHGPFARRLSSQCTADSPAGSCFLLERIRT